LSQSSAAAVRASAASKAAALAPSAPITSARAVSIDWVKAIGCRSSRPPRVRGPMTTDAAEIQ
jgi:hypothetical protein